WDRSRARPVPADRRTRRRSLRHSPPCGRRDEGNRSPGEERSVIRVLIVDDHALIRSGLRSRLDAEKDIETVGEAETAEQGVVQARVLQPDLVLLDLLLPRASGYDAIPRIREVSPGAKVLVCSAMTGASSIRQALTA